LKPDGAFEAGPTLYDLFGRRAGTVPDYPYSPALKDIAIVWTPETVSRLFEIGPDKLTPGSKMPLQRMPSAKDRSDLIDFLKSHTRPASRQ
jgi:cytochrome c